ncbi:cell division cycle-associated 7-like protein [Protopterus annectens]|uniref:cell division cycle-associated 7-like protein n=1 Tax=Protopterus annectens TaxID=7888 RepID=UPI001CFABBC2|nr:cell division cycle-associated 7-like protein [Protopterus annectens]
MAPASRKMASNAKVKVSKGNCNAKDCFRDAVPMETSSEDSCDSLDSLSSGKKDVYHNSKYATLEELRQIFVEDTESDSEIFEGFTESELHMNDKMESMSVESDRSSSSDFDVSVDEKDDLPKRKGTGLRIALKFPTKSRNSDGNSDSEREDMPKRRGSGLRISLKFPSKKSVKKPLAKREEDSDSDEKEGTITNSNQLKKKNALSEPKKKLSDTESDSEGEIDAEKENSSVLLRRSINIKENKEMLAKLLEELNRMPDLFPKKQCNLNSPKQKKTPRKSFSEAPVERRMNPSRNARPPEKFALENFALSAIRISEQLHKIKKSTGKKSGREEGHRRSYRQSSVCSVEDITEEELENIAVTVKDKIYDKVMGSTCHQCRQKTTDTKTVCRNPGCGGVRGQFCGPCLRNRYGEDVRTALLDPNWICPPCRGVCNCSFCRKRDGRCATGILIHLAKHYGYDNVREYLESLQKQLEEDH